MLQRQAVIQDQPSSLDDATLFLEALAPSSRPARVAIHVASTRVAAPPRGDGISSRSIDRSIDRGPSATRPGRRRKLASRRLSSHVGGQGAQTGLLQPACSTHTCRRRIRVAPARGGAWAVAGAAFHFRPWASVSVFSPGALDGAILKPGQARPASGRDASACRPRNASQRPAVLVRSPNAPPAPTCRFIDHRRRH